LRRLAPRPAPIAPSDLNFDPQSQRANLKLLKAVHRVLAPKKYLEIGVRWGDSLALAGSRTLALGVDPQPELRVPLPPRSYLVRLTSDEFFRRYGLLGRLPLLKPDFGFIDGMHLVEFVLRDFINMERLMSARGVIALDDTNPYDAVLTSRERRRGPWTGDVWKIRWILNEMRPDLKVITFDVAPTGLTLVRGLDPRSKVLSQRIDDLLERASGLDFGEVFEGQLKPGTQPYSPERLQAFLANE
jgi:hypothetical protein